MSNLKILLQRSTHFIIVMIILNQLIKQINNGKIPRYYRGTVASVVIKANWMRANEETLMKATLPND